MEGIMTTQQTPDLTPAANNSKVLGLKKGSTRTPAK
jgi:hypothetical protein